MTIKHKFFQILITKRELYNIILFSLGKLISLFGTFIYTFAIGLHVLKLTGSSLSFAANLVFGTLPIIIINPIAGVLADRFNKKTLVVGMDLLNGILLIGLYFFAKTYGLSITMIYASTFIITSFVTIFDISFESAKPNIVSDNNLMNINSISKVIASASTILGPMIGGVIFVVADIRFFIAFNGISFIISGISELFINFRFNVEELNKDKEIVNIHFIKDVKEGFKYLIDKEYIISLFVILIFLNFSVGLSITMPLPFILNNVLRLTPKYFGIIQSSFPVGLIIGAFFVGKLSEKLSYKKILMVMNFILAICISMIGIPVSPLNILVNETSLLIYYCILMLIVGIAISFIDIPLLSIIQSSISDEYRGRVLSLGMSMAKIISPLAFILAGVFIKIFPVYILQILGSMILLISNAVNYKNDIKKKNY